MTTKKYKVFIFDFDGTLADTKECVVESFQESLRRNGLEPADRNAIIQLTGLSLDRVFATLVPGVDESLQKKLVAGYRQCYSTLLGVKTKAFPGVKETLAALKNHGITCTVATSKKTSFAVLSAQHLGIDSYLDFYIGDDMVSKKKPDPEMLKITLKKFHLQPNEAVMIGDSTFDIQMGNRAGVDTIGVTWGAHGKDLLEAEHASRIIEHMKFLLEHA